MNKILLCAASALILAMGCGSEDDASSGTGGSANTGGSSGSSGSSGSAGSSGSGATAGSSGSAGAGASAGSSGSSGSAGSAGSGSGGTAGSGGSSNTGGATGSGGSSNTGGTGGSDNQCKLASECTTSVYKKPITSEKDCYCLLCPSTVMTVTEHKKRSADWTKHCTKWASQNPCPVPSCLPPPPVACKNNQCVASTSTPTK